MHRSSGTQPFIFPGPGPGPDPGPGPGPDPGPDPDPVLILILVLVLVLLKPFVPALPVMIWKLLIRIIDQDFYCSCSSVIGPKVCGHANMILIRTELSSPGTL